MLENLWHISGKDSQMQQAQFMKISQQSSQNNMSDILNEMLTSEGSENIQWFYCSYTKESLWRWIDNIIHTYHTFDNDIPWQRDVTWEWYITGKSG